MCRRAPKLIGRRRAWISHSTTRAGWHQTCWKGRHKVHATFTTQTHQNTHISHYQSILKCQHNFYKLDVNNLDKILYFFLLIIIIMNLRVKGHYLQNNRYLEHSARWLCPGLTSNVSPTLCHLLRLCRSRVGTRTPSAEKKVKSLSPATFFPKQWRL